MYVRDCMSSPAVTVTPDTSFQEALRIMRERGFRRLPVVDKKGHLAGIVSERDLLHAAPSPVSSLSVWELNFLLSRLTIGQIMTRSIIITTPDTPIEHAAGLMVANKIGGLPVVDEHDHVVGVVTETDIFKAFVEILDGEDGGLRLMLDLGDRRAVPWDLLQGIAERGGYVTSMGTFRTHRGQRRAVVVLGGVEQGQIQDLLDRYQASLLDVYVIPKPPATEASREAIRWPHPASSGSSPNLP